MQLSPRSFVRAALATVASCVFAGTATGQTVVYQQDFDASNAIPAEFAGAGGIEAVGSYSGLGSASSQFAGNFLRNASTGNPAPATTLTLTDLPPHDSISLSFLLAVIDSWDGLASGVGPDLFTVRVDGQEVFSEDFSPFAGAMDYVPPAGAFTIHPNVFAGGFADSSFDTGFVPAFMAIPHTADSVTIEFFAGGGGWQGSTDESWAIDNLSVTVNGTGGGTPDLRITDVQIPTSAPENSDVVVSWTVTNEGDGSAIGAWADRLLFSTDIVPGGDLFLESVSGPGVLLPGESYTVNREITLPQGVSGQRFLVVEVDSADQIAESDETDNTGVSPNALSIIPAFPDLVVTNVEAPATGGTYQFTTGAISWTVTNDGLTVARGPWVDRLRLSSDDIAGDDFSVLTRTYEGPDLQPGESYTVTIEAGSIRLPGRVGGDLRAAVTTDDAGAVDEGGTGETNNTTVDLDIFQIAPPLLEVTDFVGPATYSPGNDAFFTWTMTNNGAGNAYNNTITTYDEVYLSTDAIGGNEDDIFLAQQYVEDVLDNNIAPGGTYTQSQNTVIPASTVPGEYYIVLRHDDANTIPRPDSSPVPYYFVFGPITIGTGPDLVVTNVEVPSTGGTYQPLTEPIRYTVMNQGNARATGSWTDRVIVSADDVVGDDFTIRSETRAMELDPGESYTVELPAAGSIRMSSRLAGDVRIRVQADISNNVAESDETNNNTFAPGTTAIAGPLLEVTSVTRPDIWARGNTINVTWTVTNNGLGNAYNNTITTYDEIYLSTDAIGGNEDDIYLDQEYVEDVLDNNIAPGGTYTQSEGFTLPAGFTPGDYYLVINLDDARTVPRDPDTSSYYYVEPVTITVTDAFPDLVVDSVTGPATGATYQPATEDVVVTIRNAGLVEATGTWTDRVIVSNDAMLAGSVVMRTVTYNGPAVPPGGTYTITLPAGTTDARFPGRRGNELFIGAQADVNNNVTEGETGETNNITFSATPTFVDPALLEVTDLQVPSVIAPNNEALFTWTLTNNGVGNVYNNTVTTYDEFYLSLDTVLDEEDFYINQEYIEDRLDNNIAPGGSYTESRRWNIPNGLTPGASYYVLLRHDDANSIPRPASSPVPYIFVGPQVMVAQSGPDLVVTAVSGPVEGGTYEVPSTAFSYTVTNMGDAPATGSWNDRVAISADPNFGGDFRVRDTARPNELAPGESYTVTFDNARLPGQIAGTSYIIAFADINNNVDELPFSRGSDPEGNNARTADDTIEIRYPRLEVTSLTQPNLVNPGDAVTLTWTVTNTGQANAYNNTIVTYDEIYLSTDAIGGNEDDVYLDQEYVEDRLDNTIPVGGTYTETEGFNMPADLAPGIYYFVIRLDDANSIPEPPGDDSPYFVSEPVFIGVYPDLEVTSVQVPSEVVIGQPVEISWTVTNVGTAAVTGSWVDEFLLSDDNSVGADFALGSFPFSGTLAPGESYTQTESITVPLEAIGVEFFIAIADASNTVLEPFEGNNFLTSNEVFDAVGPDLAIDMIFDPGVAALGEETSFQYNVFNGGTSEASGPWVDTAFLSVDDTLSADDLVLNSVQGPATLAVDDSYFRELFFTVPTDGSVLPGNYFVFLVVDAENDVFEILSSNNVSEAFAFEVLSVDSPDLEPGEFSVTAAGTLAGDDLQIDFEIFNNGELPAEGMWVDRVYASLDQTLDAGDIPLGSAVAGPSSLAAGASYQRTVMSEVPPPSGDYFILIVTDVENDIVEFDRENNNTVASASTFESIAEPDLVVTSLTAPASAAPGASVTVSYRFRNQGSFTAQGPWTDRIILTANDVIGDDDDITLTESAFTSSVGVNGQRNRSFTVVMPELGGEYRVAVVLDAFGSLTELDETNNTALASNTTTLGRADLVFAEAMVPSQGTIGEAYDFSWTIRNDGDAPALASWVDRVYLSTDDTLDIGVDELISTTSRSANLAVGATYDTLRSRDWPLVSGTYYIFIVTDQTDTVGEGAGEGNNVFASGPISVMDPPLPDLEVASVVIPGAATAGDEINIQYTVTNTGTEPALGSWSDAIYLSDNNSFGGDTRVFFGPVNRSPLSPGESYTLSRRITLPIDFMNAGDVFVIVRADDAGNLEERFDNNNIGVSSPLPVMATPAPDLVAASLTGPAAAVFGEDVSLSWTVENIGNADADNPWSDVIYLSADEVFDVTDRPLGSQTFPGVLAVGDPAAPSGTTVTLPLDLATTPGLYYLIVRADGFGGIPEGNEQNNAAAFGPINITLPPLPDLQVVNVTAPMAAEPGDQITVEFQVQNAGATTATGSWLTELRLGDGSDGSGGPVVAVVATDGPIEPGSLSEVQSITLALPDTGAPSFRAAVTTDVDQSVLETDDANNTGVASANSAYIRPNLVAESVSVPSMGTADAQLTATYTARNDGAGTARPFWIDAVYLSTDNQIGNDLLVATRGETLARASGTSYSDSITFTVPSEFEGNYWVILETDRGNRVIESEESADNFAISSMISIVQPPRPDLVPTAITVPADAISRETGTVSWTITNQGDAAATGIWRDRVWLSDNAVLDSGDIALADVPRASDLAPGQSAVNSTQIELPSEPGDYFILITTDNNLLINEGIAGGEANNTRASTETFSVQTFTATAEADISSEPAGTPATITGQATVVGSGLPAANVPVSVRVNVRGFERTIEATTDVSGAYSVVFEPGPTEGGRYSVAASPQHVTDSPFTDTFDLWSMSVRTNQVFLTATPNIPTEGTFRLQNQGDLPITGVTAVASDAPEGVDIQLVVNPSRSTLPGRSSIDIGYTVLADREIIEPFTVTVDLAADQPTTAQFTFNLRVFPAIAEIVRLPDGLVNGRIERALLRGERQFAEVRLKNQGGGPTGEVVVAIPPVSWISLATSPDIGVLEPGEEATVVVQLDPPADLELAEYTGTVVASDGTTGETIPFRFTVVSDGVGDLSVLCTDEFFYYAADAPAVAGANVRVFDTITRTLVAEQNASADGIALFQGLNEAYYDLEVRSPNHGTFRTTVFVDAAQVTNVEAFMPRSVVNINWTVVPIDFEDEYTITIEAEFETQVPAPVVVIEPELVDITDVQLPLQVDFTITNYGLITADNLEISVGDSPDFDLIPLVEFAGDLAGLQSVTVPVLIVEEGEGRGGRGCSSAPVITNHELECGDQTYTYTGVSIVTSGGGCGGPGGGPGGGFPLGGTGGGFGPGGGPGGTGGVPAFGGGPAQTQPVACDPCVPRCAASGVGCIPGPGCLGPVALNCGGGDYSSPGAGIGSGSKCAGAGLDCIVELTPVAGQLICACTILRDCVACQTNGPGSIGANIPCSPGDLLGTIGGFVGGLVGRGGVETPEFGNPEADFYAQFYYASLANYALLVELFGDSKWIEMLDSENSTALALFLDLFGDFTAVDSLSGEGLSESEKQMLRDTPRPSYITPADVEAFFDRWDRSVDYYALGYNQPSDLPAGFDDNFVDAVLFQQLDEYIQAMDELAVSLEFDSYIDAQQYAEQVLVLDVTDAGDGVCASVRIQLDQTLTVTRTAFEASLEIENVAQEPLEAIGVTLRITDENGDLANDRFGIFPPALTGGGGFGVDGTGSLGGFSSGLAQWTILPNNEAAPLEATNYFVAGTLQYSTGGEVATAPLYPVEITVLPDPSLQLKYFLETIVYSDDPFTPELEPSIPFSLGLIVANNGAGVARDLTITSSQPEIIENERGLLIDFEIIGTRVGDEDIAPTLTVDLGDIGPDETNVARWQMISTLQGEFVNYSASYEHVTGLGDPRLSLIESVDIFGLNHVVFDVYEDSDNLPDFLTNDFPDPRDLPDTVHLSDNRVLEVDSQVDVPTTTFTGDGGEIAATIDADPSFGFTYIRVDDPYDATYRLTRVVRDADGMELLMPENAWQTDRIDRLSSGSPVERYIHIFDKNTDGQYTLFFDPDSTGPIAESVLSVMDHGSQIDVPLPIAFELEFVEDVPFGLRPQSSEPRGPLESLVYTFNESVDASTFVPASVVVDGSFPDGTAVDVSGVQRSIAFRSGDRVVEVAFDPPLPVGARYCVQLIGVTDRAGNPVEGGVQSIDIAVLTGDATGDLRVNNTDVGAIGSFIGTQAIDPSDPFQVRSDLNRDGMITIADVDIALDERGIDVRGLTTPCLVRNAGDEPGDRPGDGGSGDTTTGIASAFDREDVKPNTQKPNPGTTAEGDGAKPEPGDARPGDRDTLRVLIQLGPDVIELAHDVERLAVSGIDLRTIVDFGIEKRSIESWGETGVFLVTLPANFRGEEARAALAGRLQAMGATTAPVLLDDAGNIRVPATDVYLRFEDFATRDWSEQVLSAHTPVGAEWAFDAKGVSGLVRLETGMRDAEQVVAMVSSLAARADIAFAEPVWISETAQDPGLEAQLAGSRTAPMGHSIKPSAYTHVQLERFASTHDALGALSTAAESGKGVIVLGQGLPVGSIAVQEAVADLVEQGRVVLAADNAWSDRVAVATKAAPVAELLRVADLLIGASSVTATDELLLGLISSPAAEVILSAYAPAPTKRADANGDGVISIADAKLVVRRIGERVEAGSPGDLDGDGVISTADLRGILLLGGPALAGR